MSKLTACALVLIFTIVQTASALQCWKCSSDIDPTCNDHFNQTEILARRGGGGNFYGNGQQGYNQRQNYDPNYNPNFNQNFNNNPSLETCDNNDASFKRMKNVCLKKTIRGNNYVSVVRRCAMIGLTESVGTCHDPVNKGLTLEFCEYCEYDGCNSATGLKTNVLLASILAISVLSFFRH